MMAKRVGGGGPVAEGSERFQGVAITSALLALCSGCTNADLILVNGNELPEVRVELSAEVCAPAPIEEKVPYKVLFVIDTSLSNEGSDPTGRRQAAFLDAVTRFGGNDGVSFGLITFDSTPHTSTVTFTRDQQVLTTASDQLTLANAAGGTNYTDTLAQANYFIFTDIAMTANPVETLRTHYLVYWVSDGLPTRGATDPDAIVANVGMMYNQIATRVAEVKLSTIFLENDGSYATPQEMAMARALLTQMAGAGHGDFVDVKLNQSITFDINPIPVISEFSFAAAAVSNPYVRYGDAQPMVDSDADGLWDRDEDILGTDALLADTDADGYGDGVEVIAGGMMDPLVLNDGCADEGQDGDQDGLADCEEEIIGTDRASPDTDGDFLPDGFEVIGHGSPLSNDRMEDVDLDQLSDWNEVQSHLNPRANNVHADLVEWGYRYELANLKTDAGPTCYHVAVQNILVLETAATDGHPRGGQGLDFWVSFKTSGPEPVVKYFHAVKRVGFLLPDVREPANGVVDVAQADLVEVAVSAH
ncbi:MAG: VWA domain-containing protein [Deltaproteobacteria bacterium]|nr:VWA domain-containing protein [Deltaproteobacteria bacterium]